MTDEQKATLKSMIDDVANAAETWGEAEGEKYHEDEDDEDFGVEADKDQAEFERLRGVLFEYIDSLT